MNAPWIVPQLAAVTCADHVPSPVDLDDDGAIGGPPLPWTSRIVATAALFLLLFNAGAVRSWASELPPGPATDPLIAAADRWFAATHALGLDLPVETMRGWWQAAQAARLSGDDDQR
ncbi:MAG: hypothetical protein QOI38_2363 [Sphingomonadales bacterium]|nr:hypothetical protein [Sphingomonadales bacterium]